MEIKYLNTFKAILETGSFQKAAERLNYAQSTITLQMQLLEQELSVKLFEKIGRKMKLTQAGKELIPYVDNVIEAVQQMENYGKDSQELTGSLRIAIPETLLTYQMPQILKQFRQRAPNIKLSIQSSNCYDIRAQVMNGTVDIGVHYEIDGYGNSVVLEKLRQYEFVLIGSPELDSFETNFTSQDQRKELCLLADQSSCYYKKFAGYLKAKNIVLESEVNLFSTEAIKQLVKENLGIAYLPRFTVEKELSNKILQEIPTAIQDKWIGTVCTYHKNKWLSPAMHLFFQLLQSNRAFVG